MLALTRSIAILALLAAPAACGKKQQDRAAPPANAVTRIADCDRFVARYAQCERLSSAQRDGFDGAVAQWKIMLARGNASVARSVQQACQKAAPGWERSLTALGC